MPQLRLKVVVDPRHIGFAQVYAVQADEGICIDVQGVIDIAWRYAPGGRGVVVLTFDATMIDFAAPPRANTKESNGSAVEARRAIIHKQPE